MGQAQIPTISHQNLDYNITDLQYLNMSECSGIRELPESFKRLCNLLHLDLKGSFVEKGLPGALCGLTALQYLDMSEYY